MATAGCCCCRTCRSRACPTRPRSISNTFVLLALNEDATISVIDPRSGFGGTRLLGLVALDGVGEDWVQLADQERLAVTVPQADTINVVDMRAWNDPVRPPSMSAPSRGASRCNRTAAFFWADSVDSSSGTAHVVAVNSNTFAVAGRVPVGEGPHDLAFSADSRFLFVANAGAGTVSVVDVGAFAPAAEIATGPRPVSLAYSELAGAVYVGDAEDGSVTVIDARSHTLRNRITGPPGIAQIAFAPGGRYAFVVNKRAGTVTIIDSAVDRAVYTVDSVQALADQVRFTSTMAFVRQTTTATVMMLPLDQITPEPGKLPVLGFPGGSKSPASEEWPSPAASIESVGGDRAVLVANAGDREIYYYQEGLAVPMASFSNYKRQPRAVTVVRRDLRESAPGVYQVNAELGRPGSYELVFRLNQPSLYHCFPFEVVPASAQQARQPPRVAPASCTRRRTRGSPYQPQIHRHRRGDRRSGERSDRPDRTGSLTPEWQTRLVAQPLGAGRYGVTLVVPLPGRYAVVTSSADAGIDYQPMPGFNVVAPQ